MKKVRCFLCGNEYPAPLLRNASPASDNLEPDAFSGEFNPGIACPRCSTQNDVTANLPDWS